MPNSLKYRPDIIENLITNHRIQSYQTVFQPANDIELMGVYLWNLSVCAALYPLLGAAEIALRNSVDRALTQKLGQFWWSGKRLHYNSFVPRTPAPDPVNHLRNNFAKATKAFIREKQARYNIHTKPTPNHHDIVAKTEFSTWEFIFDSEFMGPNLIWPGQLGKVFTGLWPHSKASLMLSHVEDLVSTTRNFRNRLFHHEPAWKRFGVSNEVDAIQHLHEKLNTVCELITLVNPEKLKLLQKNGVLEAAKRACSSHEIRRFQHRVQTKRIRTINQLTDLAGKCNLENTVLKATVHKGKRNVFLITPHKV